MSYILFLCVSFSKGLKNGVWLPWFTVTTKCLSRKDLGERIEFLSKRKPEDTERTRRTTDRQKPIYTTPVGASRDVQDPSQTH